MKNRSEKTKYNKNDKMRIIKPGNQKCIKNGTYSITMSIIFIIVIIVMNSIARELPSKYTEWDISGQKMYSIGKKTKEMLEELEEDVAIYQIVQNGAEDEVITKLLQKYEEGSKHVEVEVKDPVVNPKFVSEYTDEELAANSLIVASGERSKVIHYNDIYKGTIDYNTYSYRTTGFDGEGQITSAIGYVTSENLPVLYTLEGHGEKDIDSSIKESIEKANIEIKPLNLILEGNIPDSTDCLLINAPETDISIEEKEMIVEYLENGGKAMIFSDYTEKNMANMNAVLANYGLKNAEGLVFEGDSQHYAMQTPIYLMPEVKHAAAVSDTALTGYYVLAPYAQGIVKTEDVRNTVTVESILTTSDQAYSKINMNSENIEKEDGDVDGPFDIGVSVTEKLENNKETKLVYYSTSSLLDSQVNAMVSGGNQMLVMESLKWMVDTEESATVSIPVKSLEVSYLTLTDYDASFWKICTIVLIPGFFLVAGFAVWLKRRKA